MLDNRTGSHKSRPETQTHCCWFYGLRIAGHFVDLSEDVRMHVMSTKAFDGWNKQRHGANFWDLNCLVTLEERARTRPIYVSQKQLRDTPLGGWSLRSRMMDASKVRLLRSEHLLCNQLSLSLNCANKMPSTRL